MTTPLFSVGGLASGLDTHSIIHQLMQLERQPVVRFEQRQAALRGVDDAWGRVTTKLSAVRTAVDQLRRPTSFQSFVATTSSNPDAVAATRTGAPTAGSVSFTVERLAGTHQVAVGGSFAARDALVGAGELTLVRTDGTTLGTITTDEHTTLAQVAERINGLKTGVSAQVVKTGEGAHRLVLTARNTGEANRFDVAADVAALGTSETLRTGVDAHLKLGTLDVYRASNRVTDLIDGVTLDLRQVSANPVTVTTERDADAAVKAVKGLVDALNGALSTLKTESSFNAESRRSGPLQGEALVRLLTSDLRLALSSTVSGLTGEHTHAATVGLSLDRHGSITLDQNRLREALADDFDGVAALFTRSGSTTDPRLSFSTATDATQPGTYEVKVNKAATVAAVTGAAFTPPGGDPKTFTITSVGRTVSVTVEEGDSVAQAVQRINNALAAAGVSTITASVGDTPDGEAIRLAESRFGASVAFSVEGAADLGLDDGTYAGENVEGTIGGLPATGNGRTLTGAEGAAAGLAVRVTASQVDVAAAGGALGTVTVTQGVAGALDRVLRTAEGAGGAIARSRDALRTEIRRFDDRIADFEIRLETREKMLRRQFSGLEAALARMQSQGAWLASQLGSLNAQVR